MGNGFKENSVNNIDKKKFDKNYDQIDWGKKDEAADNESSIQELPEGRDGDDRELQDTTQNTGGG